MVQDLAEVAQQLREQQEAVIARWDELSRQDPQIKAVSKLTRHDFRDNIPAALMSLARALEEGSSNQASEDIGEHGHHRWKQGFSLHELIRDWGNLNVVLVDWLEQLCAQPDATTLTVRRRAMACLSRFMSEATVHSVRRYDELRRAEAASLAKDLQLAKAEAEKLVTARGQLVRETVHDIRGGLAAVASASAVLQECDEPQTVAAVLERSVESINALLGQLLDLSRLDSGADEVRHEWTDVARVLQGLIEEHSSTAERKGISLKGRGPAELHVETDPGKIRRIAQNLLTNALRYTDEGEVALEWREGDGTWELIVRDTGTGIQEEAGSPIAQELDRPEHGSRSKPPAQGSQSYAGEGIGLTIVKRLCAALNASISLQSEAGLGTTFTLAFPQVH